MQVELIGLIVAIMGALTVHRGLGFGLAALSLFSLLGASAALILPALGGASIQPAHLSLAFLCAALALRPKTFGIGFSAFNYPSPGFWFALFTIYGVVTAMFLPRIFAGSTVTYSLARGNDLHYILATPLKPTATNLTQAVYLLGNLVCFGAAFAYARLGRATTLAKMLLATGVVCVGFAFLDLGTYATGTQGLMDLIRNANYRMLEDGEILGFKRIVGSFSEAGAYGYVALAFYAFSLMLWLEGDRSRLVGPLAATLLATILLATSTTAYAATAVLSLGVLGYCVTAVVRRRASARHLAYILAFVVVVPVIIAGSTLLPAVRDTVTALFQETVVTKLDSQSGVERMRWNERALISFADTAGLGGGLGSIRTSSFIVALLSNVGIPGALLFLTFFVSLLRLAITTTKQADSDPIVIAALTACFAQITAASISAGSVDLGIGFCLMAGLATGTAQALSARQAMTLPFAPSWFGGPAQALRLPGSPARQPLPSASFGGSRS